jgi:hypothetical protein
MLEGELGLGGSWSNGSGEGEEEGKWEGERYFAPVRRATLPASEGMEGSNGHFCFESGEIE